MTKGCKIWLWILMIGGAISTLSGIIAISNSFSLGFFSMIAGLIQIAGISLMLFRQKKEGFYILCGIAIIVFFINIANNVSFIFALIGAVVSPGITYYIAFVKNGLTGEMNSSSFDNEVTGQYTTTAYSSNGNNATAATQKSTTYTSADTTKTNNKTSFGGTESKKMNSNFESGAAFGAGKNMNVTVDLYKELEIDRAWDEKNIRNHLKGLQKLWTQRQGATNDKEQLLLIDKILKFVEDGYRYLTKSIKRQQYDEALERAYKSGKIVDETEEKLHNILDQAKAYYRKGKIQLAAKLAQEAVEGKVNDPLAYDLLARCYFDTNTYEKAIEVIDQGLKVFGDNINLHWLGARISTIGTKNYDEAQRRVNDLIALAPENSIGHSEQVYLHLRRGDETLAFQEIDNYIMAHPNDNNFKRGVAYDLDAYSNTCYYYDERQDASFIADKASYNKCLMLRSKAVEIFSDEHTQNQLENAKYYGNKEWNDWNIESIKSLALYGSVFVALDLFAHTGAFFALGFILYAIMGVLIYFSFRPYWQINKTYITGQMGTAEMIINRVGDLCAKSAYWMLRALIKTVELVLKFVIGLASGKWF